MRIYNLTENPATPEQIAFGVIDANPEVRRAVAKILYPDHLPTSQEISVLCDKLAFLAYESAPDPSTLNGVMIDVPHYMFRDAIASLYSYDLNPYYPVYIRKLVLVDGNDTDKAYTVEVPYCVGLIKDDN